MNKQHTTPLILNGRPENQDIQLLEKVSLTLSHHKDEKNLYDEDWIQNLIHNNPSILPVEELESDIIIVKTIYTQQNNGVSMVFHKGDYVKHKTRDDWGIGKIIKVGRSGTVVVKFEDGQGVTIPQGTKFLVEVDGSGNTKTKPVRFTKGERVKNIKNTAWGIGEVLENISEGHVKVFYVNHGVCLQSTNKGDLKKVQGVEAADPFLENLFYKSISKDNSANIINPEQATAKFLERFKGGLHGPLLEKEEREYKQQASEKFISLLNQNDFKELIDSEQWGELADRIKKCHSLNLVSKFELIKFSDILKGPQAQQDIGKGLFDFLYDDDLIEDRFKQYAVILEEYECNKWPIITLPLFLCFPSEHMFVKPTVTQEAAENRGFDIQYQSQLNWNTYNQVLLFSKDLFERLKAYDNPDLYPRDMIDVQTFMWCTFTEGWSPDEIAKAEARIKASDSVKKL